MCRGGEVFLLVSDLGGGKTTFVKGLAHGLGSTDHVGSPTFTINRTYNCANGRTLQHFDFYRLNDAGIVANELAEYIDDRQVVVAIEWGDIVSNSLPTKLVRIRLDRLASNEDMRTISFSYPSELRYLFEEKI
jgi:tRNA threonylcarbamoyladenosine biosynthesis protein TsaE